MSKEKNKIFLEQIKNYTGCGQIKLPEHIDFELVSNKLKITLPANAVSLNMQTDDAAFEGWTMVLYNILSKAKDNMKVMIDICEKDNNGVLWESIGEASPGHYNRFLYRLTRFNDAYKFVELSSELKKHIGEYYFKKNKGYYNFNDSDLYINKPTSEASCNEKKETIIEKKFSESPDLLIDKTEEKFGISMQKEINRQLPAGIFKDDVKRETAVFTGGASAIDLWGLSEDNKSMCVYELKIEENTKVGIISELFFYANLMYDVYGNNPNFNKADGNKDYRGYDKLKRLTSIETVYAIFLVERVHPLIDENVVNLLSQRNVKFTIMEYKYSCDISFGK